MDRPDVATNPELLLAQTAWVRGLARSLALDPSGADDVAQEAILAALKSPPDAVGDAKHMRAWLSRVVFNLSNLRVRRDSRRRTREKWVARPEPTPSAAETVERAAQLRLVVDEVMELEEPYRSVVLLRYFDGLTTQQTADALDCSSVVVRKRLSRALQKLREALDRKNGGDGSSWLAALAPLIGEMPFVPGAPLGAPGAAASQVAWPAVWTGGSIIAGFAVLVAGGWAGGKLLSDTSEPALASAEPAALVSIVDRRADTRLPIGAATSSARPATERSRPPARHERGTAAPPGGDRPRSEDRQGPAAGVAILGRVFDLAGSPLAGIDVYEDRGPGRRLGTTAVDGSFRTVLHTAGVGLVARGAGYATLRKAFVREAVTDADPVIIAGPAVDLAGEVVDFGGMPIEGATITLEVADGSILHGFPRRAPNTSAVPRRERTAGDGRFRLDDWVTGDGLVLAVDHDGYVPTRVPVPAASTDQLRIELALAPVHSLRGLVLHQSGAVAAGAHVELGRHSALSDAFGAFEFEYGNLAPEVALRASKPGYQAVALGHYGALLAELEYGSPAVELVLGGPTSSITGRVLDADGAPARDWYVLGFEVDGMEVARADERGRQLATRTDADGDFELDGLNDGSYLVHAVNTETLVMVSSGVVASGTENVELQEAEDPSHGLSGRVVGRDGVAVVDALVTVVLPMPAASGLAALEGESARTDEGGNFTLHDVPRAFADLRVEHTQVAPVIQDLESAADTSWMEIQVPRDRFVQFHGLGVERIEVVGGDGRPLVLGDLFGARQAYAQVLEGRSPVLQVTEDAAELVVHQENAEVLRIPVVLAFDPGVILIQGGNEVANTVPLGAARPHR